MCFSNSDLAMVRFFVNFVRACFQVADERFTVRLNVYTGNGVSIEEIEDHWLRELKLPRSCLRGHIVNHFPTSSSGKKTNLLPYGVCTLNIHDTHLVQHIYGAIQEYAGFEDPRWLDGPPAKSRPSRKRATANAPEPGGSAEPRRAPTRSRARGGPSGRGGGSRPRRRPPSARRTGHPP
jgi:hypothetical protein